MSTEIVVIPKLVVTVEGKVKSSNLPEFHAAAKKFVSQINRTYKTDADFGQAEVDVKSLKGAEKLCKDEEENVMAQTHDIREVVTEIRFIGEGFRTPRLEIEREVKEQKDHIRITLMKEASDEVTAHAHRYVDQINNEFAIELSYAAPDFYGAIKGLRTIESVEENIKKEKDAAIFSMTTAANSILANLAWFKAEGYMEHKALFIDMATIIYYETEAFKAMVELRVTTHIAAEKKREDETRERIRGEEETKARIKVEAEAITKAQAEEKARVKAEDLAKTPISAEQISLPAKEIPSPAVPRQITKEENIEQIYRIKTARALCDTFMAMSMSLEETSKIRLEMLSFLQLTDWVDL